MPETVNELNTTKEECIEKFRTATLGEEVRGALIDLANLVYTDVIDAVMTYVKKGDSITDANINQNGELELEIKSYNVQDDTYETRTENVGPVVGSDGSDGAGIQSIRLDTTVGSSTYGHLFIQVQGQSEVDVGYIIGPKGDPGETAPEHEWNVDGSFSQSSVNPVQNKVITAKLNEIMTDKLNKTDVDSILSTTRTNPVQNKVITSALNGKLNKSSVDDTFSQSSTNPVQNKTITAKLNEIIAGKIDKVSMSSNHVLVSNGSGGVKDSTKLIGNSNYFHSGSDYLALESAVKQYTYSKSESDNKYVQLSQIDQELDDESNNPVANSTITQKIEQIENDYSAPDSTIDITSTKPVQNHAVAAALNNKVNISDFNNTIFDNIDLVFSNTNGGIYYGGDCPSAPALFIEAESGIPGSPDGRNYYLSYVDYLYDSDDDPHWHRIANISNLITKVIPVDNDFYDLSKNPVQSKIVKAALDKKMEYADESYESKSLDDINHFTDSNKIYHFYLGLNNINEMVDLIFIVNDDEADWDNEVYPYSCQFMLSQSGKIYYRKTDDQGIFGSIKDFNPIDNALSTTSENPVQNKVIKAAIDEVVSHGVIIDDYISTSSTNPVQNKVISNELGTRELKSNKDDSLSAMTSDTYDRTHYPSIKCLKTVQNAIPTVPTNVSSFTNDAGYLTQHQSLSNYYTKSEVDSDLNGYQTKIDNSHKLSSDLVDDTDQTNKFVTDTDKTNWNNKLSSANGAVKSSNIDNGAVTLQKLESGVIDSTLSAQGAAAEAKTTGHHINVLTDRETALDGIVSQEWEIGMRYLVNGVETWSGTTTSRMSTKPGTYIRFNKDDLIVMKKTMDYQFLVVYSTDNGSTWTSTPNRYPPYSILDDSIGWICIRKTSGTFTEEEMQSVVNNYFFILRKGTGEIKKNALLAEALSIASGSFDRSEIVDSEYGFTYQYVSQGATQAASTELLLPEFSASAGDVFAIKASVSVDYPDMYSNIGVRIYERYNGNTVKATDITDISDTIIYTVSNSYADAIHIRGLLLADEGDITISHYEIFDYKISVVKKLPGEIEELLTEAGDIWEV